MSNTADTTIDINTDQLETDKVLVGNIISQYGNNNRLAWRVRTIVGQNPYMANNPDAVLKMAQMPISDNELFTHTGAHYGMFAASSMKDNLEKYSPSMARSIYTSLTPLQQQTLVQMGYSVPKSDLHSRNILGDFVHYASKVTGPVFRGVESIPGVKPVVSEGLKFLDAAGDFVVGRPYRTIRQLDSPVQILAGIGALIGAVALAPETGGGSIAATMSALTSLGTGAVLGGTITSAAVETLIGNPKDWINAWNRASNGERLFKDDGIKKATEILGDPKLVDLAQTLASELSDMSLLDIAERVAGSEAGKSPIEELNKIAGKFAIEGSDQHQKIVSGLTDLLSQPLFQDAVTKLSQSKISVGRDVAGLFGILDPGSTAYRFISGAIDAATVIALDPLMMAGKYAHGWQFARRGIGMVDGNVLAENVRKVFELPEMKRVADVVAKSVNLGTTKYIERFVPWMMPVYEDLRMYHFQLMDQAEAGIIQGAHTEFTADHFVDWLVGSNNLKSIMSGVGIINGAGEGTLRGLNAGQEIFRSVRGVLADAITGAADVSINRVGERIHGLANWTNRVMETLPVGWQENPHLYDALNPNAYKIGKEAANLPAGLGKVIGSTAQILNRFGMMVPRGYLDVQDIEQVRNFVDLFETVGLPSWARAAWKTAIIESPNVSGKLNAIESMYKSLFMASGLGLSPETANGVEEFLTKFKQLYKLGPDGRVLLEDGVGMSTSVQALPIADSSVRIAIPDLHTIRKAAAQGSLLRVLIDIPESTPLKAFQNKIWKPSVLLRVGFIPRNAAEDIIGFVSRAGVGHLIQEASARGIAQTKFYKAGENVVQTAAKLGVSQELETAEQIALRNNWAVPLHVRPVARVLEKFAHDGNFSQVALEQLKTYGTWLRGKLESGFTGETVKGWVDKIDEMPTDYEMSKNFKDFFAPETIKRKFNSNLKGLLIGNTYSTRRMAAGGVNTELVNSALEFSGKFGKSIMDRVGSGHLLPGQRNQDGANLWETVANDANNNPVVTVHRLASERAVVKVGGTTSKDLQDVHHAILENMVRTAEDDGVTNHILQFVNRTYGKELQAVLPADQLLDVTNEWHKFAYNSRGDFGDQAFQIWRILNEPIRGDIEHANRYRALMDSLTLNSEDSIKRLVVELNDRFGGLNVPTFEEVHNLFLTVTKHSTNEDAIFVNLKKFHDQFVGIANQDARSWVLSNTILDHASGVGNHLSFSEMERWRDEVARGLSHVNEFGQIGPFYDDAEVALTQGQHSAYEAANAGKWPELDKSKAFYDMAEGTPAKVLHFPTPPGNDPVDPTFLKGLLLDSNNNIDVSKLAFVFGLDSATMTANQTKNLEAVGNEIINSIINREQLVLADISDEHIKALKQFLDPAFKNAYGRGLPNFASTRLPIGEGGDLTKFYPDIADRIHVLKVGDKQISVIGWDQKSYPTSWDYLPEASASVGHKEIIDGATDTVRQRFKAGRRMDIAVAPNQTVYTHVGSELLPRRAGEIITDDGRYYADAQAKTPIDLGDQRYFEQTNISYDGGGELLHSIMSPVMYDYAEASAGKALYTSQKHISVFVPRTPENPTGVLQVPIDFKRARTANVDVVRRAGLSLPDYELTSRLESLYTGKWDRFVQFGFNNVIGASLDTLARRPMAFHAFHQARLRNVNSVQWLFKGTEAEAILNESISNVMGRANWGTLGPAQMKKFGDAGRLIAEIHQVEGFQHMTNNEAIAYVRSFLFEDGEVGSKQLLRQVRNNLQNSSQFNPQQAKALLQFLEGGKYKIASSLPHDHTAWDFIDHVDALFGPGSAEAGKAAMTGGIRNLEASEVRNLLDSFKPEDWKALQGASKARAVAYENASRYAAEYAIRDTMPFIDSHEFRSQFAEWGRGYLPFWYAEENFLKRWAKIFTLDGPAGTLAQARKMQLGYTGLRTMGIVRRDAQGKDYFVYPGSDLFVKAISKIPGIGGSLMPVTAMLQSPTDRMIPGFTSQLGAPGISPLIGMPLEFIQSRLPEMQSISDLQRSMFGDPSMGRSYFDYIIPSSIKNTYEALTAFNDTNGNSHNERLASAMLSAMSQLEATGHGLADSATTGERDDYLRDVTNHARIILLSQALAGWFTPGPATTVQLPEDQNTISWLSDGNFNNPADMLVPAYYDLIKEFGIDEGTIKYLELYKGNTVKDIVKPIEGNLVKNVVNPLAYTVSKSKTPSGAPLPSSENGITFYLDNKDLLDQYPDAGPWLLPQANDKEQRSKYAYDTEVVQGLRVTKAPIDFLNELKFKEGANIYFTGRQSYLDQHGALVDSGQKGKARLLANAWDISSSMFRAAHPIFDEMLTSTDSRARRNRIIDQMHYLVNDPEAPKADHFDLLKLLMQSYDSFIVTKGSFALDHSAGGRARTELLKKGFEDWANQFLDKHPELSTFWLTVLRPETGLD